VTIWSRPDSLAFYPKLSDMSKNLSALSFRKGLEANVFDRLVETAEAHGTAEIDAELHQWREESLFGDAVTLGAVSFYDFLKKEHAGKKVLLCNGLAAASAQEVSLTCTLRPPRHFPRRRSAHPSPRPMSPGGRFSMRAQLLQPNPRAVGEISSRRGRDASDNYAVVDASGAHPDRTVPGDRRVLCTVAGMARSDP